MKVGNGNWLLLGRQNWAEQRFGTQIQAVVVVEGSSEHLHPDISPQLKETVRFSSNLAFSRVVIDLGRIRPVGGVALAGMNLRPGDRFRIQAGTSASERGFLVPDSVEESSNYTVPIASDLTDNPQDATDNTWLQATSGSFNTSVRVSFPAPGAPLKSGKDLQTVAVRLRQTGFDRNWMEQFRISLWEGGSVIRFGSRRTLSSSGGFDAAETVHLFHFDASELSGPTSGDIEIQVEGFAKSGATIEVGAVRWYAAFEGSEDYDSGMIESYPGEGEASYGPSSDDGTVPGYVLQHVFVDGAGGLLEVETGFLMIEIESVSNISIEAGHACVSQVYQGSSAMKENASLRVLDDSEIEEFEGGGRAFREEPSYREFRLDLAAYRQDEMLRELVRGLDRLKGSSSPLLFIPFPEDPDLHTETTLWAWVEDAGAVRFRRGWDALSGQPITTKSYKFEEVR